MLIAIFLFAGALAAVAGGLFASLQTYITPDAFTFDLSVLFFIAILIGGRGSILGPMLGTIILTILPEIAAPLGGVVDVPLRRAAAGDRAGDARRHRGTARLPQPPSARQQPRHRAAPGRARRHRAQDAPGDKTLSLRGIVLSFGNVRAIDGLDLDVKPGQVHGLIGPNGSGKTTTLNVISGYYAASRPEPWRSARMHCRPAGRKSARRAASPAPSRRRA